MPRLNWPILSVLLVDACCWAAILRGGAALVRVI
jgi:hypothetical protein